MKFIHLGDLHLGKTLRDFNLIEDQKFMLDQILKIIEDESVDAVLIAGDVYDRANPQENAVELLDDFISELARKNIKAFIISGNHDSEERLNYGKRLFSDSGIYITSKFKGELEKVECEDEHGTIDIYMLPFIKASQVRYYYPDEEIKSYEDAVRVVLEKAGIDKSKRNIIVAHQFVTGDVGTTGDDRVSGDGGVNARGPADPIIAGSEGAMVQNVGLVEKISNEVFKDFDYVALGHLHSPQVIGREHIRYCGSMLKYSLAEANTDKSAPIIAMNEKGSTKIKMLTLKPMRDLRHIKGKMEQLLSKENVTDTEDFMYVTLTDEDRVDDAMNIIRQHYPNTVKMDYDNSHTKEIEDFDVTQAAEDKPFDELISDFYRMMYAADITEEELEIMKTAAREAGVMHEAD